MGFSGSRVQIPPSRSELNEALCIIYDVRAFLHLRNLATLFATFDASNGLEQNIAMSGPGSLPKFCPTMGTIVRTHSRRPDCFAELGFRLLELHYLNIAVVLGNRSQTISPAEIAW